MPNSCLYSNFDFNEAMVQTETNSGGQAINDRLGCLHQFRKSGDTEHT